MSHQPKYPCLTMVTKLLDLSTGHNLSLNARLPRQGDSQIGDLHSLHAHA